MTAPGVTASIAIKAASCCFCFCFCLNPCRRRSLNVLGLLVAHPHLPFALLLPCRLNALSSRNGRSATRSAGRVSGIGIGSN
jgi:hypothetical protein